jgi:hypothetical protein
MAGRARSNERRACGARTGGLWRDRRSSTTPTRKRRRRREQDDLGAESRKCARARDIARSSACRWSDAPRRTADTAARPSRDTAADLPPCQTQTAASEPPTSTPTAVPGTRQAQSEVVESALKRPSSFFCFFLFISCNRRCVQLDCKGFHRFKTRRSYHSLHASNIILVLKFFAK